MKTLLVFWYPSLVFSNNDFFELVFWKGIVGILIVIVSVGIFVVSLGILIHWHFEHWYFEPHPSLSINTLSLSVYIGNNLKIWRKKSDLPHSRPSSRPRIELLSQLTIEINCVGKIRKKLFQRNLFCFQRLPGIINHHRLPLFVSQLPQTLFASYLRALRERRGKREDLLPL